MRNILKTWLGPDVDTVYWKRCKMGKLWPTDGSSHSGVDQKWEELTAWWKNKSAEKRLMGVRKKVQWWDTQISIKGEHILFKEKVYFSLQKIKMKGRGWSNNLSSPLPLSPLLTDFRRKPAIPLLASWWQQWARYFPAVGFRPVSSPQRWLEREAPENNKVLP